MHWMAEQQRRQEEWMVAQQEAHYGKELDATRREEGLPWRRPAEHPELLQKFTEKK